MTKDTAEDIQAYEASRVMTQMYFISAEDIHGLNKRRFIEATSARHAYDIWFDLMGGNDGEPVPIDWDDAKVIEVPAVCGHPGMVVTELNDTL